MNTRPPLTAMSCMAARSDLRFRISALLVVGLIWTSAAFGDGPLFPGAQYAAGAYPSSVAIGDLNCDQVPDLAVASRSKGTPPDGSVSVLLGVGDGTFAAAVDYQVGEGPSSIAIGDLNGDQVPDVVVANRGPHPTYEGTVSVLLGVGDGTFSAAVHYAAGKGAQSVAIGDLNGDQVLDLAVAYSGARPLWDGAVSVLLGVGDGTFAAAVDYAAGDASVSLAIGDLDGDRVPDLVVVNGGSETVSVLPGVGDGTFLAPVPYATGDGSLSVAIGDLNGDQVPDLATANYYHAAVLLGLGDGTFGEAVEYPAGSPTSIAIGDLNGDGVSDLALADLRYDWNGYAVVLLGIGDGSFAPATYYSIGKEPVSIAIGDLDGDRVPDLAVANSRSGDVSVLLGLGDGTYGGPMNHAAGDGPGSVAIGDLDGDKVLDLAVANWDSDTASVLLGIGDGTFAAAVNYAAGVGLRSVAIGDLNGDQTPDLAVANAGRPPTYYGSISVLLGVGDGTFSDAVHYAASYEPKSIAIGDLNGDQVPDLAVANGSDVSVLLGVGDGTFSTAASYAAGYSPRSVAVGDLNADQVPDLAVATEETFPTFDDNVAVLLGVGDGTFAAAVHYTAGYAPTSVAIGDLNGDQVPDLAIANWYSDSVSVLLGAGDGTLFASLDYAAGRYQTSVAIGDLDGDQVPDLTVTTADRNGDNVSVLAGRGDGTFAAAVDYPVGIRPVLVAIGDLNGDQKSDLAVANSGAGPEYPGSVSVLLNQRHTRGDINGDGRVDRDDFALFAGCMGGPGVMTPPSGCDPEHFERADVEGFGSDVDQRDFALFARYFRGAPPGRTDR